MLLVHTCTFIYYHTVCARIDFEQMFQRMRVVSMVDVKFQQEKNMHSHSLSISTLIWRPPTISFFFKLTEDTYNLQFPALTGWSLFSCFSFPHDNAHWCIFFWGGGEEDFAVFIPTCGLSCSTTQPHVSSSDSSLDSMLSDSRALPRFNGAVSSATNSALISWVSSHIAFLAMEQQYNQNTEHIINRR